MSAGELSQMFNSLRGLETTLLAVMRKKGIGPSPQRGLKDTEAETIKMALEQYRWNISETAKALGIGRNTLYRKIKQFGLLNRVNLSH
jgi:two-component system NtrC family response regulator